MPRNGIAASYGNSSFKGTSILFFIVVMLIYIPMNIYEGFLFFSPSPAFDIGILSNDGLSECEMLPHCSSDLLNLIIREMHLLMCYWPSLLSLVEKAMAPHSSTLAWKIPWMEEPGGLQSMGSLDLDTTERLHFHFYALEKEMATHSSVLAWRIPGTGEPGGLPSMVSHRVGHD